MSFPFHDGELDAQSWALVPHSSGAFIRPEMPQQHREFFPRLPFLLVGSMDPDLQATASLLAGPPGFVGSSSPDRLEVAAVPPAHDPLSQNLRAGVRLGILGIEPHTRRRNRVGGRLADEVGNGFVVLVEQSFGNCPKYITPRRVSYSPSGKAEENPPASESLFHNELTDVERRSVESADTFFLASAHPQALTSEDGAEGVDVSHRGGPPGFIRFIAHDSLVIPDFPGNNLFNSIGNIFRNPKVGLLFWDFENQDILQVHAWAEPRKAPRSSPHERELVFQVLRAQTLRGACGLRSEDP
jgi:uncharacterized protein